MTSPAFGLNRWDMRSPEAFAASVRRGEELGFGYAFIPSSPLLVQDPYVMLAEAARATSSIRLGPLIETPVMRHPAVIAGSIATLDRISEGRAYLGLGAGDTAVRLVGRRPASVRRLEEATALTRALLAGEAVDLGADEPARLRHAAPVPVWIAAGGPRTLRMAGRVADGVMIRAGTHEANLRAAVEAVRAGAEEAGRDPDSIRLGVILHTVLTDEPEVEATIGRSIAAGYYEYSPMLLDRTGESWDGPDVHELQQQVWPDFHHAADLEASGAVVSFLSDQTVDDFCLHGPAEAIVEQLRNVLSYGLPFEIVVPHPMAPRRPIEGPDYMERIATEVMAAL